MGWSREAQGILARISEGASRGGAFQRMDVVQNDDVPPIPRLFPAGATPSKQGA